MVLILLLDELISKYWSFVQPKFDATLTEPNVDAPVKTPVETLMRPLNMHDREKSTKRDHEILSNLDSFLTETQRSDLIKFKFKRTIFNNQIIKFIFKTVPSQKSKSFDQKY